MAKVRKMAAKKAGPRKFLLAYDLSTSAKNNGCRRKFYKKKKSFGLNGGDWTRSVVVSSRVPALEKLRRKAVDCGGRAKLFKLSTPKKKSKKKTL
jgi:hypothetical protein